MDAVKRKLHGVRVLLHGIAFRLRTARAKMDAVEESSHGIYVLFHGCLRARGVEAGEMLADHVCFVGWERGLGAF